VSVRGSLLGVAIFGVFALAYLWASPSLARQHWDSLEYAAACEARGLRAMWGNHPLGHLIACGAFTTVRDFGYAGRALPIMRLVNGVAAAAAVSALFVVLTTVLGAGPLRSVGWAVAMGSAAGPWHYAGTAEVYGLSVLSLIVAWGVTVWSLDRPSCGRGLLSGIAFGVATLCHQFGGVILMTGTIALLTMLEGRGRRRPAVFGVFAASAVLTIVAGYVLLGLWATGSSSPTGIVQWAIGHGRNQDYGHSITLDGVFVTLGSAATAVLPFRGPRPGRLLLFAVATACLALVLVTSMRIRRLPGRERAIAAASALQWLAAWLLIAWWEPRNQKLWLLTLPAFVMTCDLALTGLSRQVIPGRGGSSARRPWAIEAAPILAGTLLFLGSGAVMLRERQPDVGFERSLKAWVAHSRPDDILVENGRYTAHLLFWERRAGTVSLYRILRASAGEPDRFAALREVIARAARTSRSVLYSPILAPYYSDDWLARLGVTQQQVRSFFDQYQREGPLFEYQASDEGGAQPVYRLVVQTK